MRQSALILLILAANFGFAANEEQFTWMGIEFCEASVGDVLEQFPSAIYHGDYGVLWVDHLGETFGANFNELFFYVRPDGIVFGVHIAIISGDFREIEREIDDTAAERWDDEFYKIDDKHGEDSHDYVAWAGFDDGTDVHMHLHNGETSPLYKLGLSEDGKRAISIGLKSVTGCDLAKLVRPD